jgi:hypothetical protein
MAEIGDSLRQTVSNINDELSKSIKSINNSFSSTSGGQPIAAYSLAGFTIILLGVMLMRSKESDADTSLLGTFSSKETSSELAEQASEETIEQTEDLENQQTKTDSSDFSLFGNVSPSEEKKDDDNSNIGIFSNETEQSKPDDVSGISSTDFNLDSNEQQIQPPEQQIQPPEQQIQPPEQQIQPPDEANKIGGKKRKSKKNRKSKRKYTKKRC